MSEGSFSNGGCGNSGKMTVFILLERDGGVKGVYVIAAEGLANMSVNRCRFRTLLYEECAAFKLTYTIATHPHSSTVEFQ